MGLNILKDRFVAFDDSHQQRVDTSVANNPTRRRIDGVDIHFVFRRNRTGDRDRDGNPLLYALKGMNGYKIANAYRLMFMNRAKVILDTVKGDLGADVVMPIPSNYPFCGMFAATVADRVGVELMPSDFLTKRTVGDVLADPSTQERQIANKRTRGIYTSQLDTWSRMGSEQMISMKELDPKIRPFFQPMRIADDAPSLDGLRILLVDDLMSTGASICGAARTLRERGAVVDRAVCFLSGL